MKIYNFFQKTSLMGAIFLGFVNCDSTNENIELQSIQNYEIEQQSIQSPKTIYLIPPRQPFYRERPGRQLQPPFEQYTGRSVSSESILRNNMEFITDD